MLNQLKISPRILQKLLHKHRVSRSEVEECFLNRTGGLLTDTRLDHRTNPPTQWFIAPTDAGRRLKVVFIRLPEGSYEIKTAYEPNLTEERIYDQYA